MKKVFATATAFLFTLGLAVAAQAQSAAEKPKAPTAPVQKVVSGTQEQAKDTKMPEAPKTAPAEAKKAESAAPEKKAEGIKEAGPKTDKDMKNPVETGKMTGQETPKKDKP